MTFCARALCLSPTPEYVFAYPAIYPFALLNKALLARRTLDGIRDVQRLFRSATHLGAFRSGTAVKLSEVRVGGPRTMPLRLAATGAERAITIRDPSCHPYGRTVGRRFSDAVRLTELDRGQVYGFGHHSINLVERTHRRPVFGFHRKTACQEGFALRARHLRRLTDPSRSYASYPAALPHSASRTWTAA